MATTMKKYDTFFAEAKKQGKSDASAHTYAAEKANKGAVKAIKDEIKKQPMSKAESEVKSFLVRSKMEAKLKSAERNKARREKLSKMSIEELKELEIEKRK